MLRFVILAILFFLVYRLLVGSFKSRNKDEIKQQELADGDAKVSDILVEDPVCHTLIPRQQAIHLQHQGEIVYFCSEECCNIFVKQGEEK
ncbi:MAG: YHS domain-containing protein [Desulfobulbaceae bacterium]|nr:MAG: YHS domain-containing protein [Desulfobulbaceae bacterium]